MSGSLAGGGTMSACVETALPRRRRANRSCAKRAGPRRRQKYRRGRRRRRSRAVRRARRRWCARAGLDLGGRIVLMQRRVADIALTRAGEKDDHRLDPVGQPHRDPLAALEAGGVEIGGDRVDRAQQFGPVEPSRGVAQRGGERPLGGVLLEEGVERVLAPQPGRVITPRRRGVVQGEKGIGHGHSPTPPSGAERGFGGRERREF